MKYYISRILFYAAYVLACSPMPGVVDSPSTLNDVMASPASILVLGILVAAFYQRMTTFDFFIVCLYLMLSFSMYFEFHNNNQLSSAGAALIIILAVVHFYDVVYEHLHNKNNT